ncbi:XisH family protein [Synechococcus sp. 7002]|uniref:XisH family protein n=1 Tax=Synechococcus sp. 7002 TaxID=1938862 RepID=UPI000A0F231D|nr:XisH family protein [Synechococcus sp. 7002]SMH58526.1 XisH protein [Picosynechococcus sp. OG1]
MAAKDKFHEAVKTALIKENWTITHNPLNLKFGEYDQVQIDLGAEQVLGAEKDNQKIAVEIKSFLNDSALSDFHLALGPRTISKLSISPRDDRTESDFILSRSPLCLSILL